MGEVLGRVRTNGVAPLAITVGAGVDVDVGSGSLGRLRRPRLLGKGFDPLWSSLLKKKGRKTYVQTHTALAHALDRPAHGGRLSGILAHPQQPRRTNHTQRTDERTVYTVASNVGT